MNDQHKHELRAIGERTYNGDKWMQVARVFHCAGCGGYFTSKAPVRYYDYGKKRSPEEVSRLRSEEQAAYDKLIADHRANPKAVEQAYRDAEAARAAMVRAAIERSRAERGLAL